MKKGSRRLYHVGSLGLILLALLVVGFLRQVRSDEHAAAKGRMASQRFWSSLSEVGKTERAKASSRPKIGPEAGLVADGYPRRAALEGPVRSTGLMGEAAEVYNLRPEQIDKINQAISQARIEIATVVVDNLVEVKNHSEKEFLFVYHAQVEKAIQIQERFRSQLRDIAGERFADAGSRVFQSDAWFLEGGAKDIEFTFKPTAGVRREESGISGSYTISVDGTRMGGQLEYLSPEDLCIDFRSVLMGRIEKDK